MLRFSCSCLAGGRWFCSPRVSSALGNAAAATHHTQPDSQTSKSQWPQDQPGDPNSCCKVGILQLGELLICRADLEIALCLGRGGTGRGAGQRALPQFHLTGSFGKNLLVIQRSLSVESQTRWGSVQEQLDSDSESLSHTPKPLLTPRNSSQSFPNWTILPHEQGHGIPWVGKDPQGSSAPAPGPTQQQQCD